ncbi:MAG: adenosine deaminase [Chromatocurvus sp.]
MSSASGSGKETSGEKLTAQEQSADANREHDWLAAMPKCELHLHIDGSLQPARLLELAEKNAVAIPHASVADIARACEFTDLQSFLDLYYLGASVLRTDEDFYHLMMDYLLMCRQQNILHSEIMVEPQTYAPFGVTVDVVMRGFVAAIDEARREWGQSVLLILSFLRHLSEDSALDLLRQAQPWKDKFVAIGLASAERDHPPEKFRRLYSAARELNLRLTAHAGEEGPPAFIEDALDVLGVERIDHGVRAVEHPPLLERLRRDQVPLTVCPLSNVRLCVVETLQEHPILDLLAQGLCVTVNSDDPAYFGGYLNENYTALQSALGMRREQALALARNGFNASFLEPDQRTELLSRLDRYAGS